MGLAAPGRYRTLLCKPLAPAAKARNYGAIRTQGRHAMAHTHAYALTLDWTGNKGHGTAGYRAYDRDYKILIDGKVDLLGSSDPAFLGDPARHNPEDMFLASISACHMLWFLHLASDAGIVVTAYRDAASGEMVTHKGGAGEFTGVTLRPQVTITDPLRADEAHAIHDKVGDYCFIARSIKVPIAHEPEIMVAAGA